MLVLWTSLRWLVGLVGLYRPLAIWNPGHFSFSEFALVGACLCVLAVTSVLCVCGVNPVNAFFRIKWAPHDVVSQFCLLLWGLRWCVVVPCKGVIDRDHSWMVSVLTVGMEGPCHSWLFSLVRLHELTSCLAYLGGHGESEVVSGSVLDFDPCHWWREVDRSGRDRGLETQCWSLRCWSVRVLWCLILPMCTWCVAVRLGCAAKWNAAESDQFGAQVICSIGDVFPCLPPDWCPPSLCVLSALVSGLLVSVSLFLGVVECITVLGQTLALQSFCSFGFCWLHLPGWCADLLTHNGQLGALEQVIHAGNLEFFSFHHGMLKLLQCVLCVSLLMPIVNCLYGLVGFVQKHFHGCIGGRFWNFAITKRAPGGCRPIKRCTGFRWWQIFSFCLWLLAWVRLLIQALRPPKMLSGLWVLRIPLALMGNLTR